MSRTQRNRNYRYPKKEPYRRPTAKEWEQNNWYWIGNPYYFKKEFKGRRKAWWRKWRYRNKVNLKKHGEIEPLPFRTEGWLTH